MTTTINTTGDTTKLQHLVPGELTIDQNERTRTIERFSNARD